VGFSGKAMATYHVALEAVAELKAHAEAKFHMYCFVLH
jgi:hypothetical protein